MKPSRLLLALIGGLLALAIVLGSLPLLGIKLPQTLQPLWWGLLLALLLIAAADALWLRRLPTPRLQRQLPGNLPLGRWSEVRLTLHHDYHQPLVVQAFGGTIGARGTADFSDSANPAFRLSLALEGLSWTPEAEGDAAPVPVFLRQALLGVAGTAQAWAVNGLADIAREQQQAALKLDIRGNQRAAFIHELVATTPGGKASVEGRLGWEPALAWEARASLDGFDPGYFLPGWDGRLSGQVLSSGARQAPADPADPAAVAGPLQASVDIPRLQGQLRGRPLQASASVQLLGEQAEGKLELALGNSQVSAQGKVGSQLDVQAQLQPLQLDDLLPGSSGSLAGSLALRGRSDSPDITADLRGSGLRWGDYQADSVSLVGELPWRGRQGQLALQASQLQAGMALDNVQLSASGNLQQLALAGDFNIAPDDRDVHDPAAWAGQILCSDAERSAFQRLQALGLHDSFRLFEQPEKTFSWWDYRMLGFRRNQGLRIDHILLSAPLRARCTASGIDRDMRKRERPSDHAPVIAELAD